MIALLAALLLPVAVSEADCLEVYTASGLADAEPTAHAVQGEVFVAVFEGEEIAAPVLNLNGAGEFAAFTAADGRIVGCARHELMDRAAFEFGLSADGAMRIAGMGEHLGEARHDDPLLYASRSEDVTIADEMIDSAHLSEPRQVSVYAPDADQCPDRGCPVIYTGDIMAGDRHYNRALHALIEQGRIAPVVMASTMPDMARRGDEYARRQRGDQTQARFEAHEAFFLEDFMGWVEAEFPVSKRREDRILFGYSNSAEFAIEMLERHPGLFGAAVAASPSLSRPVEITDPPDPRPVLRIAYGDWERPFADTIEAHGGTAEGVELSLRSTPAGHSKQAALEALIDYLLDVHPGPEAPDR